MAERSFKEEVKKLRLGAGEEFHGEAILAVTKALLQSGVSYVAGYQGAPISHLMDVLADANDILEDLSIRFENSASEATAAATLAASVNYPLRGAVTFKSPVGTNVDMVEKAFQLSEASHTPVMFELRIRACHVYGHFPTKDNARPAFGIKDALERPNRDVNRIALPPATYVHEKEKIEQRWPAAVRFISEHKLNEFFAEDLADIGIVVQGGLYNNSLRALEILGLADAFGESRIPLYVLNVTYPLIDAEFVRFCAGKKAILIIEEGQPDFIEQAVNTILRRADLQTKVDGKNCLPMAGEYTGGVLRDGIRKFIAAHRPDLLERANGAVVKLRAGEDDKMRLQAALKLLGENVHGRPQARLV